MQSDSPAVEKLIALKLFDMNWFDRRWMLARLDKALAARVKTELSVLKQMKVQNAAELLAQISNSNVVDTKIAHKQQDESIAALGLSNPVKQRVLSLCSESADNALHLRKALNDYLVAHESGKGVVS